MDFSIKKDQFIVYWKVLIYWNNNKNKQKTPTNERTRRVKRGGEWSLFKKIVYHIMYAYSHYYFANDFSRKFYGVRGKRD